jgi:hypothetical protein
MIYTLHCFDSSIYTIVKEMSIDYCSAEFHPKRKKLKYWQKKRK